MTNRPVPLKIRPIRILVVTPWAPIPVTGACQQDRYHGLRQMVKMGWETHVIARYHHFQDPKVISAGLSEIGTMVEALISHERQSVGSVAKRLPQLLRAPALFDGAALEYATPAFVQSVVDIAKRVQPDAIWLEYTVMWPLIQPLKRAGFPVIMKSSINEPLNCIDEHNGSLISYLKAIPKFATEWLAAKRADYLLAISPEEERWYKSFGARRTAVLPLRGLARCLEERTHADRKPLNVVFMGSNYNIGHNRKALEFLLKEIVPKIRQSAPDQFVFHVTGKKVPEAAAKAAAGDIKLTGFIEDLGEFLRTMDIAVTPVLAGRGMQQKIFEPFCRSIPQITTHTCGYPFVSGAEVLIGTSAADFAEHLLRLRDAEERNRLSRAAFKKAQRMFSEDAVMAIMREAVAAVH